MYEPAISDVDASALGRSLGEALRDSGTAGEAETEMWARALITDAIRSRASDIHLDSQFNGVRLRFRIDGAIHDVARIPGDRAGRLLRFFKVLGNLDPSPSHLPEESHMEFDLDDRRLNLRLTCAPCVYGDKLALRFFQRSRIKRQLAELGLSEIERGRMESWLGQLSGMLMVAGPVGSGKTTTLYSLLAALHVANRHIVTIEDPVEYYLEEANQIEVDVRRGLTFEAGLRATLRLDPDCILLGEIRDKESAFAAMEAATTGRVVLTSMHSRNVAGVITALRGLGVPNHEIAASLAVVVSQRLVRKLCTHCRLQEAPTPLESRWLESCGEPVPAVVWHASQCEHCAHTGYFERTGLFEVAAVDDVFYDLILAGQDEHSLHMHLRDSGVRLLFDDGLEKAAQGITDLSELRRISAQSYAARARRKG